MNDIEKKRANPCFFCFFTFKKCHNVCDFQIEIKDFQSKKEGTTEELCLSALYAKGAVRPNLTFYAASTHHTVESSGKIIPPITNTLEACGGNGDVNTIFFLPCLL